jgi:hypothetical protein
MKLPFIVIVLFVSVHSDAQNVGIGSTAPVAKLEVRGDGNTSLTNNLVLKNLNGDTLLRVRNDGRMAIDYNGTSFGRTLQVGGNGMNIYINDETFSGAVFPTDTSLVIWSQIEDNNYVILQPSWGKVGIGTFSPKAKLDVNGDFILGEDGSILTHILKSSVAINIGSIAANASIIQAFTITGASIGSTVFISPNLALPDGLVIAYARVSAANTVEVKFTNTTAAAINPASMSYHITVID